MLRSSTSDSYPFFQTKAKLTLFSDQENGALFLSRKTSGVDRLCAAQSVCVGFLFIM